MNPDVTPLIHCTALREDEFALLQEQPLLLWPVLKIVPTENSIFSVIEVANSFDSNTVLIFTSRHSAHLFFNHLQTLKHLQIPIFCAAVGPQTKTTLEHYIQLLQHKNLTWPKVIVTPNQTQKDLTGLEHLILHIIKNYSFNNFIILTSKNGVTQTVLTKISKNKDIVGKNFKCVPLYALSDLPLAPPTDIQNILHNAHAYHLPVNLSCKSGHLLTATIAALKKLLNTQNIPKNFQLQAKTQTAKAALQKIH